MTTGAVEIVVTAGHALRFDADVLVLKYAQALHGIDKTANRELGYDHIAMPLPPVGASGWVDSTGVFGVPRLLVLGMPPIGVFGYSDVREFGRRALHTLAVVAPQARHLAMTLHGVGFGLDETEAFESAVAGLVDAIGQGDMAISLQRISFVENDAGRVSRLTAVLARLLPTGSLMVGSGIDSLNPQTRRTLGAVGLASATKPRVFVAMPFAAEMDDIFHYGIQGAANAAGLLCERADLASFTGDVVDWVKARIAAARLVVADLSSANPNVYLEVGYAWGKGVPTVLLVREGQELKFDVKTQRCIVYRSIKHLEEGLARELLALAPGR